MTIKVKGRTRYAERAVASMKIRQINTWGDEGLLFDLKGVALSERGHDNAFQIEVMHPTATDEEHDAAKILYLEGAGLKYQSLFVNEIKFTGVLLKAHYYPDGVPEPEGSCYYHEQNPESCDDHGYLEYMPPQQKFTPVNCEIIVRLHGQKKRKKK